MFKITVGCKTTYEKKKKSKQTKQTNNIIYLQCINVCIYLKFRCITFNSSGALYQNDYVTCISNQTLLK
jgi:hypothetical protein